MAIKSTKMDPTCSTTINVASYGTIFRETIFLWFSVMPCMSWNIGLENFSSYFMYSPAMNISRGSVEEHAVRCTSKHIGFS